MTDARRPKWLVCSECQTVRAGRYTEVPEGWRVIAPGAVHCADTHHVYANVTEYRQAVGVAKGSVLKPSAAA